jgi:hypothetical protein
VEDSRHGESMPFRKALYEWVLVSLLDVSSAGADDAPSDAQDW